MSSRPDADRILLAQLDGEARYQLRTKATREAAIAELHAITTRTDLLTQAAATALAAWRDSPVSHHDGDRVAQMLIAAGADPDQVEQLAAVRRGKTLRA